MGPATSRRLRPLVHVVGLAPLVYLLAMYSREGLGADPVGEAIRRLGRPALAFLVLSLVPGAVRLVSGSRRVLWVRRALGLYAFLYAVLHVLSVVGLDYAFDVSLIVGTLLRGRRVYVGLGAFLVLVPLAVTSTGGWMKRLGRNWKRLHRVSYLAAALAVLHYVWTFKEVRALPLLASGLVIALLVVRLPPLADLMARARRRES